MKQASALPDWPALMDAHLAAAYFGVGESTFLGVVARAGVRPVDLGVKCVRWRRRDLDALLDKLPPRTTDGTQVESEPAPAALMDPAEAALASYGARLKRPKGERRQG